MTIREEEARHLRVAYDGVLAGRSLAEVTRRLTAAGSTSSTGRPWTPQHLRTVLLSPRFAGLAPPLPAERVRSRGYRLHQGDVYAGLLSPDCDCPGKLSHTYRSTRAWYSCWQAAAAGARRPRPLSHRSAGDWSSLPYMMGPIFSLSGAGDSNACPGCD